MNLPVSSFWSDYELIDTGGLEKLERFGKYILTRPEPQAVWEKSLQLSEWENQSHAVYKRTKGIDPAKAEGYEKGEWIRKPGMPDQWIIGYEYKEMHLKFRLGLTAFGHIGVFPEQAENWNFIYDSLPLPPAPSPAIPFPPTPSPAIPFPPTPSPAIPFPPTPSPKKEGGEGSRILNLFAYTGGASMAAKAAGADVIHVDSVKNVVTWAKEMMELSGLKNIRWVVEDALKFVRREVKRGNKYNGIIIDPPAYGRGPEGEKWILQDSINEMIKLCSQLLEEKNSFFILSLYSMGFSSLVSESLVRTHFGEVREMESGELFFPDRNKRKLPLGTYLRFNK